MSVRTYENRETKRRNADVKMRIEALHEALDSGRQWLSAETITRAEHQLAIARGRLRQSLDHTVIALSGPTGAGKSSLMNALADKELARVSVRRPTTSQGLAAVWDSDEQGRYQAGQLLDWLGVSERHYLADSQHETSEPRSARGLISRSGERKNPSERIAKSASGVASKQGATDQANVAPSTKKKKGRLHAGLIVVDLPDFDSVVAEHRIRADHLTERADLLVWVTDPQKYADAVFHHEYLKRFSAHSEMLVVLNQVDRLTTEQKEQCLSDIRRLLTKDGISGATVLAVSTKTGEGISQLQSLLEIAAARRAAHGNTLIAELRSCGRAVADECGQVPSRNVSDGPKEELVEALSQASGVYTIADAVYASAERRSHIATGWPVTAWLAKFKKDPLSTLGLAQKWVIRSPKRSTVSVPQEEIQPATARSSMLVQDSALAAKANTAVREYVDAATLGGPTKWVLGVRKLMSDTDLVDDLDSAITNSPSIRLGRPMWWKAVGVLHKLLLVTFLAGFLWLGFLAVAAYLRLEVPNAPSWMGFPIPTLLTLGGLVVGIVLGLVCRLFSIVHARRQSRRVFSILKDEVQQVAHQRVVLPVREAREQREACLLAALVAAR